MLYHNINPVLLRIGQLEIRYYGLIYALGFIIAYWFLKKHAKETSLSERDAENLIVYLILSVVVGARLFYVLFYNLGFYLADPLEILKLWHGGLSFHGGLFGGVLAGYIFCRKKRVSFLKVADLLSIPLAIALFFGRIANFINGELYGRITTMPWGVRFKGVEGFRHPSQIYEALKNLFIFAVLVNLRKKQLKEGLLFGIFLVLYGILRFFIEFWREPEVYVGPLTMGQLLSIITAAIGMLIILRAHQRQSPTAH